MAVRQPLRNGAKANRSRSAASPTEAREIPDKLYFRIGEVARLCGVAPYVLRFWESEFPQLKPNKGGTGQRLYRRRDVELALRVKTLLHDQGYTIAGARQLLRGEHRAKDVQPISVTSVPENQSNAISAGRDTQKLRKLRAEMQSLLELLSQPIEPGTQIASRPRTAQVHPIRSAKIRPPKPEFGSLFDGLFE